MMISIIQNMSWIDSNSIAGTVVVNKGHKKFHLSRKLEYFAQQILWQLYNIDRLMVLKRFHGTIIMRPGRYDYHSLWLLPSST